MPSKPYPRVQYYSNLYRLSYLGVHSVHRIARPLYEVCLLGYGHVVKGFSPGER